MSITGALNQSSFMNSTPTSFIKITATGLSAYNGPWGKAQASHLVRRTHFGNKISDLNRVRSFSGATEAATTLVDEAKNAVLPDDPSWFASGNSADVLDMYDTQFRWMDSMYQGGFLARMLLFWTNHFAVSYQNMNDLPGKAPNSYASHMYKYVKLLQTDGFGDFKELVRKVSKNSAMLYYLNNYNNRAGQPNEDFARELLELFTLGTEDKNGNPNYTEGDIAEVARAVTGWRVNNSNLSGLFDSDRFDAGQKTIFGQTDNYNMDSVIDLIFSQKADKVAWFLSKKLYNFFVSAEPDNSAIQSLADYCLSVNFDIAETLKNLFSSAHFYEERFFGARIKSPIEVYMSFLRQFEIVPSPDLKEFIRVQMPELNEELLRPETVFGWSGYNPPDSDGTPGHYTWLNTNLMPARWSTLTDLIYGFNDAGDAYDPIRIAEKVSDPLNPFSLAEDIAEHVLSLPLDQVGIRQVEEDFSGDPAFAPDVSGFPEYKINLSKILLGPIPWYEWTANTDNDGNLYYPDTFADALRQYIAYLIQLPAYQLI
jgi:uncharacterized protein (DUF1800 family)